MRTLSVFILLAALSLGAPAQDNMPSVPAVPLGAAAQPTPVPVPSRSISRNRTRAAAATPGGRRRVGSATVVTTRTAATAAKPVATPGLRDIPAEPLPSAEAAAPRPRNGRATQAAGPAVPSVPLAAGEPALPRAPATRARGSRGVPVPPAPAGAAVAPGTGASHSSPITQQEVKVDVRLERIRIQRSKVFVRPDSDTDTDTSEAAQWEPGMGLQIRVIPPKEWDVIEISDAKIQQVLDQKGQPMPGIQAVGAVDPATGAPAQNPLEPLYKKADNGALLLLRTSPPPLATRSFQLLDARIKTLLGYRQVLNIPNIRAKIGAPILRNTAVSDLVMQIDHVNSDTIDVLALGALSRVGTFEFIDASGKKLVPYNTEMESKDADPQGGHPGKVWHFAFTKLPNRIDLNLTYYPFMMPRNLTVKFTNVPLP